MQKQNHFDKSLIKSLISKVPLAIWMDNKLGKDWMPLSILSKFGDDPMKYVQVREQTKVIVTNSRAITPNWSMRFGWMSNLT